MATPEQLLEQAREFHQKGQMQTALELYRAAVQAQPRNIDARTGLGLALMQVGLDAQAVEQLERAVKLDPTSAELLCNLAIAHRTQGRLEEALDCYTRAAWMSKKYPRAVAGAAEIYGITGRQGKAHAMLLPYIASQQDPPAVALTYARCCLSLDKAADGAAALARHLSGNAGTTPAPMVRVQMLLTFAQCVDKLDNPENAFAAATDANRTFGRRFDAKSHVEAVDTLIETWTAEKHKDLPRAAVETDVPVLLVGMPRAGHALVEQIIASHPQAAPAGETALTRHIVSRLDNSTSPTLPYFSNVDAVNYQNVNESAGFYTNTLNMIAKRDGYENPGRIVDRLSHNFLYLGLLDLMLPNARVIHVKRDPMDTFISCYMNHFDIPYFFKAHPADWLAYYQSYQKLMEHWKGVVSMPMLEINYEDLVNDFDTTARKIIEFVGLEWDDACSRFYETPRSMVNYPNQGILKPIYDTSVGRAEKYAQFLGPLREQLGLKAAEESSSGSE